MSATWGNSENIYSLGVLPHTHALFAEQSQSILDNLMELLGQSRACDGSAEAARSVVGSNVSRPARRLYSTVRGAECPHCASTPQRQPNTPQDGTVALPCRWATKFLYPSSTHQPLVQTLPNSQDCPCSTERGVTQENILRWNTPERPMNITAVPRFHNRIMTVASNR